MQQGKGCSVFHDSQTADINVYNNPMWELYTGPSIGTLRAVCLFRADRAVAGSAGISLYGLFRGLCALADAAAGQVQRGYALIWHENWNIYFRLIIRL